MLHTQVKHLMQTKYNEATINRPEGERVLDAPYVVTDMDTHVKHLKEEEAWEKKDYNSMTIYKTKGVTIVLTCLRNNASISNITVDGLLTVQVLTGAIDFIVDNRSIVLEQRQLITLHPEIVHTIRAREESTILLTNVGS